MERQLHRGPQDEEATLLEQLKTSLESEGLALAAFRLSPTAAAHATWVRANESTVLLSWLVCASHGIERRSPARLQARPFEQQWLEACGVIETSGRDARQFEPEFVGSAGKSGNRLLRIRLNDTDGRCRLSRAYVISNAGLWLDRFGDDLLAGVFDPA